MDLIGPYHFILVLVDYATQYPEAVLLCNISAECGTGTVLGHLSSLYPERDLGYVF